ncbi:hypothetical protein GCM10027080_08960 [Pedococcus soli]
MPSGLRARRPHFHLEVTVSADTDVDHDTVPPANKGLLAVAAVLLALPMIALLWVSSYSRKDPELWGFPFFIWYQFLWVFLCSAMTYAAYRLVLKARPHRPMPGHPDHRSREENVR